MRPHPLLAPPLTPYAREQAARALREARGGLRFARRHLARSRPGDSTAAAWWMTDAAYLRATAHAIRCGALHDTATHGWPYLAPQPVLPPVPNDTHAPFLA